MSKEYANLTMWSDVDPYEVIETRTPKKKIIRAMSAELDKDWKPEVIPGGFLGHCTNQHTQKWNITSCEESKQFPIRLHKDGWWRDKRGARYRLSDKPVKFYDYNF